MSQNSVFRSVVATLATSGLLGLLGHMITHMETVRLSQHRVHELSVTIGYNRNCIKLDYIPCPEIKEVEEEKRKQKNWPLVRE